jgi:hypothetical protein
MLPFPRELEASGPTGNFRVPAELKIEKMRDSNKIPENIPVEVFRRFMDGLILLEDSE